MERSGIVRHDNDEVGVRKVSFGDVNRTEVGEILSYE